MLVLSRRVGERLLIGDDIVITVIEVRSDGVRLGIDAPRDVRVHRAEVIDAVRAANVEAAGDVDESAVAQLRRLVPRPAGTGAVAGAASGVASAAATAPSAVAAVRPGPPADPDAAARPADQ